MTIETAEKCLKRYAYNLIVLPRTVHALIFNNSGGLIIGEVFASDIWGIQSCAILFLEGIIYGILCFSLWTLYSNFKKYMFFSSFLALENNIINMNQLLNGVKNLIFSLTQIKDGCKNAAKSVEVQIDRRY